MRHRVILPLVMAILGFLTIPWLGPKDIGPKGKARTHRTACAISPKVEIK